MLALAETPPTTTCGVSSNPLMDSMVDGIDPQYREYVGA